MSLNDTFSNLIASSPMGFVAPVTAWGKLASRINARVQIAADQVKPLTTPPYDDGAIGEEMIALCKKKFAEACP